MQAENKRTWCSRGIQRLSRWISQQTEEWKAWKDQKTALLNPVQTLFIFLLALYHLNPNNAEEMVKGKAHALGKPSRRQLLFRRGSHICPQSSPVFYTKTLLFEFLAADGYSAVKTRDRCSIHTVQQTCFHLHPTKETSVLETSALEDKGQFHIPNSDIPVLRDVNGVAANRSALNITLIIDEV